MQNYSGGSPGDFNPGGLHPLNDNTQRIVLVNQTQPQPLQTQLTIPIPEGQQFGQARFVLETVDPDGAASLSHNVNQINAAQNNVLHSGPPPVEASPSLNAPSQFVPSNGSELLLRQGNGPQERAQDGTGSWQETPSLLGIVVRSRSPVVNNLFPRDQSSFPYQSASGFSADNMNVASGGHLAPLPSENLNLHQHYEPQDGTTVGCLHCGHTGNVNCTFIHGHQCPVLVSLQKVKDNWNVSSRRSVRQLGACGGNEGLSNQPAQTACKKPTEQPQYPHQVSEATAGRQQDILNPPNCQTLTPPNAVRPGEEYVRAEGATSQDRTESRIPGHSGGVSPAMLPSNNSSQSSSRSVTHSSSMFRTARGSSVSQGGGDRDNSSLQNFVSAVPHRVCHPRFERFQERFASFWKMPKAVIQSAQSLAEAGMYYTGYKDTCRCFYCGGDLHSWAPEDDPWKEHARHYPNCGFVRGKKGQGYIDEVKNEASSNVDSSGTEAIIQICKEMGYESRQVQHAVVEYNRRVTTGRISRQSDKLNAVLNILEEASDQENTASAQTAEGSASLHQRPNSMDARYCSACKLHKATVSQQKCGHIVCKECAPKRSDKEPCCKYCWQKVEECNPVDTSFYH